ncbi:MAG TPA: hypothetical protein VHQ90_13715 [Thermoanaerobaculia bacterium]|nr:hypothetical protein [Thermoanaerobaculia bacterium]
MQRGSTSYVVRFRGRPHLLGKIDRLSLEDARELGRVKLLELAREREQPSLAGRRKTLAELAELHLQELASGSDRAGTIAGYRLLWRVYLLPRVGGLRLGEVTPEVVMRLKRDLRTTPVSANRALQQLSAALSLAVRLKWVSDNPADRKVVEWYPERPRGRALSADEYQRLGVALREAEARSLLPSRTLAAIRLLLLTGARPCEILGAEVSWLRLDGHPRIELPEAKGDRPGRRRRGRSIWLSPAALAVIQAISRPPGCRWLIPGDDPGCPLGSVRKAWGRICRIVPGRCATCAVQFWTSGSLVPPSACPSCGSAEISLEPPIVGASPMAARHGYRSAAPRAGVVREHAAALMGHQPGSRVTDEVYLSLEGREQSEAAGVLGEHLARLMGAGI